MQIKAASKMRYILAYPELSLIIRHYPEIRGHLATKFGPAGTKIYNVFIKWLIYWKGASYYYWLRMDTWGPKGVLKNKLHKARFYRTSPTRRVRFFEK